jgi:hypothetical protein
MLRTDLFRVSAGVMRFSALPGWQSFADDVLTSFGVARTQEHRLFRLVDLGQRAAVERNSAETLAVPV